MPRTTFIERLAQMTDENLFGFFVEFVASGRSREIPVPLLVEVAARWRRANRIIAEIRSKTTMMRTEVPDEDREAIYD